VAASAGGPSRRSARVSAAAKPNSRAWGELRATAHYRGVPAEYVQTISRFRRGEGYVGKAERFRVDLVRGKPPVPKRE